jgi:hypothetical protein
MNEHKQQMLSPPWRVVLAGLCLGIVLAFNLSQISGAGDPAACGVAEKHCRLSGGFSGVSAGGTYLGGITASSNPPFGSLVYDPDLVQVEQQARAALARGLAMRESIDPYKFGNDFNSFVRTLDAVAGFDTTYQGVTPYNSGTPKTLNQIIIAAETDLRQARDLYAFLLVYAPEADPGDQAIRFRADPRYTNGGGGAYGSEWVDNWNGTDKALCDPAYPEELLPEADPQTNPGEVLPPKIDWCDFHARFRQSVREAANIRMIYGQEFKVDALGVNFSGAIFGGEAFVVKEVAKLRAAKYQFEQAENLIAEGLERTVGSGCMISDLYTQTEWALLSRAAEEQGNVRFLIATRLSYLGAPGVNPAQPQAEAQANLRSSAIDQYIKLAGISGLAERQNGNCIAGASPDADLISDMAGNILETQRAARELAAGRNIFGFDVTMTPARFYKSDVALDCNTQSNQGARGLWDQAKCEAEAARVLQLYQEDTERTFENSQQNLRAAINGVRTTLDAAIDSVSGCNATTLGTEAALTTCVDEQVAAIEACILKAGNDDDAVFADCMTAVEGSDAQVALFNLRSIFLEYKAIELAAANIKQRIDNSNDANATITHWLEATGIAQTAAEVAGAVLDGITCVDHEVTGIGPSAAACGIAGGVNAVAAAAAGATSTHADVTIQNAENSLETKNLLLDQTELLIEARAANQAYFAAQAEVEGMAGDLAADLRETLRQRAWFTTNPANDPSFRIVRDSARLTLAKKLEGAAKYAYLAARRAEYEYAFPLYLGKPNGPDGGNFRISDIYRARTADDVLKFLGDLEKVTSNLEGDQPSEVVWNNMPRISVAKNVLLMTDDIIQAELIAGGNPTPSQAQIDAERIRQFRLWVADHTVTLPSGKQELKFDFQLAAAPGGMFEALLPASYTDRWLYKLSGHAMPRPENEGVAINLVTAQNDPKLTYRAVKITQAGMTQMRSQAGCTFDFNLMQPAAMLGFQLPTGQNPDATEASFSAPVNEQYAYPFSDMSTPLFNGYPVAANKWTVVIKGQSPGATPGTTISEIDMDLQQLEDIQLLFSVTRASSTSTAGPDGMPLNPADCARIDW